MKTRIKIFPCKEGVETSVNEFIESLPHENFYDLKVNEYFISVIYKDDILPKDVEPKQNWITHPCSPNCGPEHFKEIDIKE